MPLHAGHRRLSLLEAVVGVLRERGIPHAVIGAAALAFHGVARSTGDLDLLAVHGACLDAVTWRPIAERGYGVTVRTGDESDPLAGVARFDGEGEAPVDLVVGKSAWQAEILTRAEPARLLGVRVPIVRSADLILLKLYAGGPQDLWDIAQILSGEGRERDVDAVGAALPALPAECRSLWQRILAETTPG